MKKYKFSYCNYVVYKGQEWFWSLNYNTLFARDLKSGDIRRVGEYVKSKRSAYNNVVLYAGKIVMVPAVARRIMIYDIVMDTFRHVEINHINVKEDRNLFCGYVVSDNLLYMLGSQTSYILKFNMDTEKIEKIERLRPPREESAIFFKDAVMEKGSIILPLVEDQFVFEVNAETLQGTLKRIDQAEGGFSSICKAEEDLWLFPKDGGAIMQWNPQKDTLIKHEIEQTGYQYVPSKVNFHSGIYLNHILWVFPFCGDVVLSIDPNTGCLSSDNAINRCLKKRRICLGEYKFTAAQVMDGCIYLLCSCIEGGEVFVYHPQEDRFVRRQGMNEISSADYLEYKRTWGIHVLSEGEISLSQFIDFVASCQTENASEAEKNKNICGQKIYELISADDIW